MSQPLASYAAFDDQSRGRRHPEPPPRYRSEFQRDRDRIIHALEDLPPDTTIEEAIERLVFLAKIDAGLAELDAGKGVPHDEAKRRLGM